MITASAVVLILDGETFDGLEMMLQNYFAMKDYGAIF